MRKIHNIYNPQNQTAKELIDNFIIRKNEFDKIFKTIKEDTMKNPPQHFIIQGLRGSGKSTLLLRIYYEITRSKDLSMWLIPIIFNEEQYSISKLFKFWENIAIELENIDNNYIGLFDKMQNNDDNENYEENCYNLLFERLNSNNKKMVVFIDNIGDMLQKFSRKEQQRLREILITNNNIRIIGASSVVLETTYNYKEPFYEFFKIINLQDLKKDETQSLLLQLDKDNEKQTIKEIINNQPGRIESLRILTSGVPRTIVLLYEIFINDSNGDSFHDLEALLDSVTTLYKHRMDDLSAQQQEIVDVIALNWDAMPVKEIVRKTRMESKAVSAQLNLLEKNYIIIKKTTSTKNNFYQLKESFFNIWYLMRNGRKSDKSKVKWLTKFLEIWCDSCELDSMIKYHIQRMKQESLYDSYVYHISESYAQLTKSSELQIELLSESKKYLETVNSELSKELSKSDIEFFENEIIPHINKKEYDIAIKKLKSINSNTGLIEQFIANIYNIYLKNYSQAEKYYLIAIEKGDQYSMYNIGLLYDIEYKDYQKVEKYYLMAIEKGNINAMYNLAMLYNNHYKDYRNAEKYYLMAIEKGDSGSMSNIALLYQSEYKDFKKAEKYYLMAIEKDDSRAIYNLAMLYHIDYNDYQKAEKYYLMAIEKGYSDAKNNLAFLYYILVKNKTEALNYSKFACEKVQNLHRIKTYILNLLWNNEAQKAIELSKQIWENEEFIKNYISEVKLLLLMLIAKKQYSYTYKLFQENKYNLKDRFKPVYYALMHFMQNEFPDEINKANDDIKVVVESIVKEINQMAKDYA